MTLDAVAEPVELARKAAHAAGVQWWRALGVAGCSWCDVVWALQGALLPQSEAVLPRGTGCSFRRL